MKKIKRMKTEITNNSSKKDDLSWNQARTEGGGPWGPGPPSAKKIPGGGVQVDNFRAA
jgi:hypothetical protein